MVTSQPIFKYITNEYTYHWKFSADFYGKTGVKIAWEQCHEKYIELQETIPAVLCNQQVVMIL